MAKAKPTNIQNDAQETKRKRGRGPSYLSTFPDMAYKYCLLGATDEELAAHFSIACSTLYEWKKKYPEFSEAIKKGKKPADAIIAHALFERAKGAEYLEEVAIKCKTVEWVDGHKIETEHVEVVRLTKQAPPDTTACIFFLKNRDKAHWSDVQKLEHSASEEFLAALQEAHRA